MKSLLILVGLSSFLLLAFLTRTFAIDCPEPPSQINKDWEVQVDAAIAKIGPVSGGDLKTRTRNATQDLLSKLPNADKVYLYQMLYSGICSSIRDNNSITDSEKARRLMEAIKELQKTIYGSSSKTTQEMQFKPKTTSVSTEKNDNKILKPQAVFYEDFKDNSNNWKLNDTMGTGGFFYNGDLILINKVTDSSNWNWWTTRSGLSAYSDFEIIANITKIKGPNDWGYGLTWGDCGAWQSSCTFLIAEDGHYKYYETKNNKDNLIINWANTNYIKNDKPNELKITKKGKTLSFYINNSFINSINFNGFLGGNIGFYSSFGMIIACHNLKVSIFPPEP